MRLDLILCDRKSYSYEGYCEKKVTAALEKRGHPYKKIYLCDGVLYEYINYLKEDPPASIISFNDLFHHDRPFCDIVRVPQFFWAMHSLSEATSFLDSDFGKIGLPYKCELEKTIYLPHGVELSSPQERIFDAVCFSPLVDLNCLEKMWRDFFPQEIVTLIHSAIDTGLPPFEAVQSVLDEKPVSVALIMGAVETYQRAKWTYEAITTFEGGYLDVFGEHKGKNWLKRLPNAKWIRLHYKLPYTECLEVIKQSKKVLLNPLELHWKLPAVAAGCYSSEDEVPTWENQVDRLIEALYES